MTLRRKTQIDERKHVRVAVTKKHTCSWSQHCFFAGIQA